jgi:hypothetical protein
MKKFLYMFSTDTMFFQISNPLLVESKDVKPADT